MTAHVFIVNKRTLPLHLQHGFAGTGKPVWQFDPSMAADVARVRIGDEIFFYVEGVGFAGCFEATGVPVYCDPPTLVDDFGLGLAYRVPIAPKSVYPGFVSEVDALDLLPPTSTDILWTLIYRKLRGRRGCTAIFPTEAETLRALLAEHAGDSLPGGGVTCVEDPFVPVLSGESPAKYDEGLPAVRPRFDHVASLRAQGRVREADLELAVVHDLANGGPLADLLDIEADHLEFLGNQVYAGVGMQAIDVLALSAGTWHLIELKWEYAYPAMIPQMKKYSVHLRRRLPHAGEEQPIVWVPLTLAPRGTSPRRNATVEELPRAARDAGDRAVFVEWEMSDVALEYHDVLRSP